MDIIQRTPLWYISSKVDGIMSLKKENTIPGLQKLTIFLWNAVIVYIVLTKDVNIFHILSYVFMIDELIQIIYDLGKHI